MGDTVVAMPALRRIRQLYPGSRITLLTNLPVDGGAKAAPSMHILEGTGLVDAAVAYPHRSTSIRQLVDVIRRIRAHAPTICIFLMYGRTRRQVLRDRIFFRLAGIRRIVGMAPDTMRCRAPGSPGGLWESEAARALRAVDPQAAAPRRIDFDLRLSADERLAAARALREQGIRGSYVAVGFGTKVAVNDWGAERWRTCLRALGAALPGTALVALGSQVEAERSAAALDAWPGPSANLCGRLTPRQSAAAIERARLFLGHDSGPMHMASAVGTPLVAVFSARNMPGEWFPVGQEGNVVYRDVPCRGCRLDDCVVNRQRCMTDISPAEVVQKALEVLGGAAQREIVTATAVSGALTR